VVDSLFASRPWDEDADPLCIQFVNTVGSRNSSGADDYWKGGADLAAWMAKRGLLASSHPLSDDFLQRARSLRSAIYAAGSAIAAHRELRPVDLDAINDELCEALSHLELIPDLTWRLESSRPEDAALMLVTLSAARLLLSQQKNRIRECANERCGWIFIDRSKNRSRKWCDMSDCGNRAKAHRFQAKKRAARSR
jgi:predicted RNA-binding Zn ribbon-like protein